MTSYKVPKFDCISSTSGSTSEYPWNFPTSSIIFLSCSVLVLSSSSRNLLLYLFNNTRVRAPTELCLPLLMVDFLVRRMSLSARTSLSIAIYGKTLALDILKELTCSRELDNSRSAMLILSPHKNLFAFMKVPDAWITCH